MDAVCAQNKTCRPAPVPMEISFPALLGWVLPLGILAGGVGLYPTYRWAGGDGILALIAAGVIALVVVLISGYVACVLARKGPAMAAGGFVFAGMIRVVVCVILAAVAWQVFGLVGKVVFFWTCLFYGLMMLCEAGWMSRALSRDARRLHLGQIHRDPVFRAPVGPRGAVQGEGELT